MYETADRAAVTLLALMASDEEWEALVRAESVGDVQKTGWVQELRIEPSVLLAAAAEIRANSEAFRQVRQLVRDDCPTWPCWIFGLTRVILEAFRMYYELRLTPGGTGG